MWESISYFFVQINVDVTLAEERPQLDTTNKNTTAWHITAKNKFIVIKLANWCSFCSYQFFSFWSPIVTKMVADWSAVL